MRKVLKKTLAFMIIGAGIVVVANSDTNFAIDILGASIILAGKFVGGFGLVSLY